MNKNTPNLYLFKAIEAYPWELEKAVEALNYALAYEPENVKALCLMAKVYSEQLGDNERAKEYYESALAARMDIPDVYPEYIKLLTNNDDFDMAQKLIDFALTIKGIDKGAIYVCNSNLLEAQMEFEKAENMLKDAKQYALNNDFMEFIEDQLSRVVKKREAQFNKEKKPTEINKTVDNTEKNNTWLKNRLNNLL